MSYDPSQPANPYAAPTGGYIAPLQPPGPDLALIFGIIALVIGAISVPLSCCPCVGMIPGGLAVIFGIVALVVPSQEGSSGKMLGVGGIVLGIIPFAWTAISFAIHAANL